MLDLENRVHNCSKCKESSLSKILPYPPVYSFGNPEGKDVVVIGLNPSAREYINGYLSNSPNVENRRESQLKYFERRQYRYFIEIERFFADEVREKLGWVRSPWTKVGYLDLVKCPTTSERGQWSKISSRQKGELVGNCEGYLKEQLGLYKPMILIPYGVDVGRWFADFFRISYQEFEDRKARLDNDEVHVLFVPQRQGPHSTPEIIWIRKKLLKILVG